MSTHYRVKHKCSKLLHYVVIICIKLLTYASIIQQKGATKFNRPNVMSLNMLW